MCIYLYVNLYHTRKTAEFDVFILFWKCVMGWLCWLAMCIGRLCGGFGRFMVRIGRLCGGFGRFTHALVVCVAALVVSRALVVCITLVGSPHALVVCAAALVVSPRALVVCVATLVVSPHALVVCVATLVVSHTLWSFPYRL